MKNNNFNSTLPTSRRSAISSAAKQTVFIIILLATILSVNAMAQSAGISVGSASGLPGASVALSVGFSPSTTTASSLQFDLLFSSSVTYVSCSAGAAITAAGKSLFCNTISGGARFIAYGGVNAIGAGNVADLQFSISGSASTGSIPITISGIVVSDANGNSIASSGTAGSVTVLAPADTVAPAISISSPTSSSTYSTTLSSLTLGGTASDNVGVTQVSWMNSRGGSGTASGTTSWSASGISLQGGSNVITVTARDAANNSGTATLTVTYTPPDTTPPVISITSPTSSSSYSTASATLSLGGTASDNVGVTQVTWTNDRGGSGTATGTTSWAVSGIGLQSGSNVITVSARDAANNSGTSTLTVTYTPADTTAPAITITSPTSSSTYSTTSATLNLGGTASDNVGVTQVSWANSRGGSGTATGTATWTVSGITLQSGSNVITMTAKDAANNGGTGTLTVTYTPLDTTAPTIAITSPTSGSTYSTTSSSLTLGGTASDNVAVTQVTWSNSRGGSGTASGTTSWSVSGVALLSGSNVITVTARDAANNSATGTLTVTYTPADTTAPAITITSPTSSSAYSATSATLNLGGTASDNVGVTQVTWANSRGGSGTATGTTSWSVSGVALLSGSNVITVTARDAANNSTTGTLTVTYTPADTTAPAITITSPTSGATYSALSSPFNLGGMAADNVGVAQVTWANSRGGSGIASGTTNWSVYNIALQIGSNVITVTARDAAGNSGTGTLIVIYDPMDTTVPAITITSPTSGAAYSAASDTLNLSGTAADNVGVTQVTWASDRGGSGTATGTTNWSVSGVTLQSGTNVITITARDAAGNAGSRTLTVSYGQADTTPPVISNVLISSLAASSATITWTTDKLSDSQVEYGTSNSYGGSASSANSVTAHSLVLSGLSQRALYHYRVKSKDAAGNNAVSADYTFTTVVPPMADFNGDLKSDVIWRNSKTGDVWVSPLSKDKVDSILLGNVADQSWEIVGIGDFTGDGKPDILWRHYGLGENYLWFMNGTNHTDGIYLEAQRDLDYKIVGVGDFNADGKPDILWLRQVEGTYSVWFMDGTNHVGGADLVSPGDISWQVAGIADFDGDGNSDILWRNNATGECRIELMNNTAHIDYRNLPTVADLKWMIVAVGDYNGDGQLEILWKNSSSGNYLLWYMNGTVKSSEEDLGKIKENYEVVGDSGRARAGFDFNNDGNSDVLWTDAVSGDNYVWLMNGTNYNGGIFLDPVSDLNWKIVAAADFNNDGKLDLLWRNQSTGENSVWYMDGTKRMNGASLPTMTDTNWKIVAAADFDSDGNVDILWRNSATGQDTIWLMNGTNRISEITLDTVQDLNWKIVAAADFNSDGTPDLLWYNIATGEGAIWLMNGTSHTTAPLETMQDLNWKMSGIGDFNKDGTSDILWRNPSTGDNQVWFMEGAAHVGSASLPTVSGQRWRMLMQRN